MKAPRKVESVLRFCAVAESRSNLVSRATATACKGCPGPLAPDGCSSRKFPPGIAKRNDWPMCPRGLRSLPAWQDVVDVYASSKVSPIANFPDGYTAWAVRGVFELHRAVREEQERQDRERAQSNGGAAPQFPGRRSAKVG